MQSIRSIYIHSNQRGLQRSLSSLLQSGKPLSSKYNESAVPQQSKRGIPNFFVGIRLPGDAFRNHIELIQNHLRTNSPRLSKCLTRAMKLHLTCFVMELNCENDINAAVSTFLECQDSVHNILSQLTPPHTLYFDKLQRFNSRVLFASPMQDDTLDALKNVTACIREKFEMKGIIDIVSGQKRSWNPHATLAKTSADRKHGKNLHILPIDYNGLECFEPIPTSLTTIDLLKMSETDNSGYYKSYAQISIQ